MSETLTFRQLLEKYSGETVSGTLLVVEADLSVNEAVLATLKANRSIQGLEVITSEDKSLGVISRMSVVRYLKEQSQSTGTSSRGGNIGTLEGNFVTEIPKYQCNQHDPPYQRLVAIARPEPPKCRICNEPMEYIG